MADREKGTVKWFSNRKGFGFIVRPSGEDVFVHFSAINVEGFRTLAEGQEVSYELVRSDKGFQAKDVSAEA